MSEMKDRKLVTSLAAEFDALRKKLEQTESELKFHKEKLQQMETAKLTTGSRDGRIGASTMDSAMNYRPMHGGPGGRRVKEKPKMVGLGSKSERSLINPNKRRRAAAEVVFGEESDEDEHVAGDKIPDQDMATSIDNQLSVALTRATRRLVHPDDYEIAMQKKTRVRGLKQNTISKHAGGDQTNTDAQPTTSDPDLHETQIMLPFLDTLRQESSCDVKKLRRMVLHRSVWVSEWFTLDDLADRLGSQLKRTIRLWYDDGFGLYIGQKDLSMATADLELLTLIDELSNEEDQREVIRKKESQDLLASVQQIRTSIYADSVSSNKASHEQSFQVLRAKALLLAAQCERDAALYAHDLETKFPAFASNCLEYLELLLDGQHYDYVDGELWCSVPVSMLFWSTDDEEQISRDFHQEEPSMLVSLLDVPCADNSLLQTMLIAYEEMDKEYRNYLEDVRDRHLIPPKGWVWGWDDSLEQSRNDGSPLRVLAHIVDVYNRFMNPPKPTSLVPIPIPDLATVGTGKMQSNFTAIDLCFHNLSALPRSTLRSLLLERLKIQFPSQSQKAILRAKEWYLKKQIGRDRVLDISCRWNLERKTMVLDILRRVQAVNNSHVKDLASAKLAAADASRRANLRNRLISLRTLNLHKREEQEKAALTLWMLAKAKETANIEKERRCRELTRHLLKTANEEKEKLKQSLALAEEVRHREWQKAYEALQSANRKRTRARKEIHERKVKEMKEKADQEQRKCEDRERRLETLRAVVRPVVERSVLKSIYGNSVIYLTYSLD
ncbi:hypothetical protein HDU93_007356 [Gonapodya sp. JEL0774]|nr:hypothetical protein HDU93_007356 [Gonapodya sp. JEL0774]